MNYGLTTFSDFLIIVRIHFSPSVKSQKYNASPPVKSSKKIRIYIYCVCQYIEQGRSADITQGVRQEKVSDSFQLICRLNGIGEGADDQQSMQKLYAQRLNVDRSASSPSKDNPTDKKVL